MWLDDGAALFDRLGPDFTLLRIGADAPAGDMLVAAADAAGVPLHVLELSEEIVAEVYDAKLVPIRPDLMIAWRSHELPANPAAVIDAVRGAP